MGEQERLRQIEVDGTDDPGSNAEKGKTLKKAAKGKAASLYIRGREEVVLGSGRPNDRR